MCGIAGKMWFDATAPAERQVIERMTSVLAHRGPDAEGFHLEPGIGLGHRRLSIIDLPGGEQPMPNETGSIWVVFNGEIYNYQELRRDLLARGHRFRSTGDTEVIVHAYEEWGEDAVTRFRGMFAYALWDAPRRRLVLVRDRMGVKPLFFARTPGGVTFGSEIKALLQDPAVPRSWSPEALDAFLTLQYIPSPLAIYTHVEKLPAGHLAVVERGHVTVRQYWDLTFGDDGAPRSEASCLEQLEALVDDAVRSRLVSDVPLGAFLSGGIDSSLVVSSMAAQAGGRVVTTSVGFEEQAFNELEAARLVAGHLGTASHEHIVQPDIAALLPRLAWHFDEPFSDSSAVPTFHVSAAARRHVTVALSGDGGDELWAGYTRHRIEHREAGARHWLGAGSKPMGRLAALLPLAMKGARSLRHLALSPADACARKHAYDQFEPGSREAIYTGDFRRAVAGADPLAPLRAFYDRCPSPDPVDRALYVDAKTYLTDDIMVKVDRMSMAVSLEAREPLLDHPLLEFAARVPSTWKLRDGRGKYLLRRLLARRVPQAIVDRPKQGFAVPIGAWLRGPLVPLVDDLLFSGRMDARGVFAPSAVARLWDEHRQGRRDHRHRLWSLVMLELWFRHFVDGPVAQSATEVAA